MAEAWQTEIKRLAPAIGHVVGEARVVYPFGAEIGTLVQPNFERALDTDARWRWQEGEYRYEVEGGRVGYRPDTGELEFVAQLADVEGQASQMMEGAATGETERIEEGTYYDDDDWSERIWVDAGREARIAADEGLAMAAREARRAAEEELAAVAERRRAELSQQAVVRLEGIRIQVMRVIYMALSGAYRDAILAYARQQAAESVQVHEEEGVTDIQFEVAISGMRVRVVFRHNSATGETEKLMVHDLGSSLPTNEHGLVHDHIAAEIGRIIERHPVVVIERHPEAENLLPAAAAAAEHGEAARLPDRPSDERDR